MLLSAIEKQLAWAAAMSSSGLVPGSSSNRVLYEYFPEITPEAPPKLPDPFRRSPCHSAAALRVAIVSLRPQDWCLPAAYPWPGRRRHRSRRRAPGGTVGPPAPLGET